MGDTGPDDRFQHAHVTDKVKGRGGGVSVAKGVSDEELGTRLVPDLEDVAPEGGEEPEFLGTGA